MRHKFKIALMLICGVSLAALFACTPKVEDQTPAKTLESYIEASFNVKGIEDKAKMENLLTGDTKQRLSVWSDEQFLKAFVETKTSRNAHVHRSTSQFSHIRTWGPTPPSLAGLCTEAACFRLNILEFTSLVCWGLKSKEMEK